MFHEKINLAAPCKINLHLNVKGRRADGFHDIESLFQLTSLSDSVSVSTLPEAGAFRFACEGMRLPGDNTVSKAVAAFREKTGVSDGIEVSLVKRVPAGAGLGGGSSDAAAVLCALNRLFGAGLSKGELGRLALETGSDAPFFIDGRPSCVSGRGELIAPVDAPAADYPGVLVWPGVHSGTAEAYTLLDSAARPPRADGFDGGVRGFHDVRALLSAEYSRPPEKWRFYNSFTDVVAEKHPLIKEALADVKQTGALFSEMSGSGSAVFGIFGDTRGAEKAFSRLSAKWKHCYSFFLLAFSPVSPHN